MIVMKFGGAVLQHAAGFRDMVSIIRSEQANPIVVVVSALGSTTRSLIEAAETAMASEYDTAAQLLSSIEAYHHATAAELLDEPSALHDTVEQFSGVVHQARVLLRSISVTRQLSPRTLDRLMALGEDLSRILACSVLRANSVEAVQIDARELIVTSSEHGAAKPLFEKSAVRIEQLLAGQAFGARTVVVTQGFVGQSEEGATTTMGKESSNLTAVVLGATMGASEVVIWTDVEGVRSIDPKFGLYSAVRTQLSYKQARHAAVQGLKLIYPTMISPAEEAGIPIRIASAHHPLGESTCISDQEVAGIPVFITSAEETYTSVTVMFTHLHQWLQAVTALPREIHDSGIMRVHADQQSQAFTIAVRNELLYNVLESLHHQLCGKTSES
jgi:aspartate kinase